MKLISNHESISSIQANTCRRNKHEPKGGRRKQKFWENIAGKTNYLYYGGRDAQ